MPELLCVDCPLARILQNINELAALEPLESRRNTLNELAADYYSVLGGRALEKACEGPQVVGTVCGLDRYARLNNEIADNLSRIRE